MYTDVGTKPGTMVLNRRCREILIGIPLPHTTLGLGRVGGGAEAGGRLTDIDWPTAQDVSTAVLGACCKCSSVIDSDINATGLDSNLIRIRMVRQSNLLRKA